MSLMVLVIIENGLNDFEDVKKFIANEAGSIFLNDDEEYPFGIWFSVENNSDNYIYEKEFHENNKIENWFYSEFDPKYLNCEIQICCSEFSIASSIVDFLGMAIAKRISFFLKKKSILRLSNGEGPYAIFSNGDLVSRFDDGNFDHIKNVLAKMNVQV